LEVFGDLVAVLVPKSDNSRVGVDDREECAKTDTMDIPGGELFHAVHYHYHPQLKRGKQYNRPIIPPK